ncbi:MAG TPA: glycoside hydrolase family 6 protein [Gaiellaceae bacterium]|nr:glycoside hydrolase family 6 protein [Gaiellaceae bacterium]
MHARVLAVAALAAAAVAVLATVPGAAGGSGATRSLDASTQFYVPGFEQDAKQQWAKLISQGERQKADLLAAMENTSHAVWLTGGSPNDVRVDAQTTTHKAEAKNQVPVFVLYDLPFRDCAQYSAGGATDTAAYEAWIDGVVRGIGSHEAVVLLEPDGLGLIPYNVDINGNTEWCQPDLTGTGLTPATANQARYVQLDYAVDALEALPNVRVYLDGTHSGWLGVGDAAQRLFKAGVERAQGFFVDVSNYQTTERQMKYGTWILKCIWFGSPNSGSWGSGHFDWCASQYYPASPGDFSTWTLTDQWYTNNVESQTWVPYPGADGLSHFVVDTSRNGQGPWTPTTSYPDPQDWCNPPGRGLGLRPTADTGDPFIDAYLWVKTPGQSDGSCTRGLAGPTDPEWGIVDPPAGAWFPQQARQLAQLAEPPLQ